MPRRSRNRLTGKFAARAHDRMIGELQEFSVAFRTECSIRRRRR